MADQAAEVSLGQLGAAVGGEAVEVEGTSYATAEQVETLAAEEVHIVQRPLPPRRAFARVDTSQHLVVSMKDRNCCARQRARVAGRKLQLAVVARMWYNSGCIERSEVRWSDMEILSHRMV